jgi:hypothetical protein
MPQALSYNDTAVTFSNSLERKSFLLAILYAALVGLQAIHAMLVGGY